MRLMVFDVGGTAIKYSVVSDGEVLASGEKPTPRDSLEDFVATIASIKEAQAPDAQGIAMSLPGIIDTANGYCHTGGALAYNYECPLGEILSEVCGCPVALANDAKCAALAELREGSLRGCRDGCVLILGTAVGMALVLDGQLRYGPRGAAGELSLAASGLGGWGDIHIHYGAITSTSGLLRHARDLMGLTREQLHDGRTFFSLLDAGEKGAKEAFDLFCREVALQVYNLCVTLDLTRVAIGGGISARDDVLTGIVRALDELVEGLPPSVRAAFAVPEVVRCTFGASANQRGAHHVFCERYGSEFT